MATRKRMSRIPHDAVAPLSLLIEAAAAPELFRARHVRGSQLEQVEVLDALTYSAVTLPHLVWEWAMYSGRIPLRSGMARGRTRTINTDDFWSSLGALSRRFPLEFSMPLPPRGVGGSIPGSDWGGWSYPRMRARASDRLHVVSRTVFVPISFGKPADVSDSAIEAASKQAQASGQLPAFGEPSLPIGSGEAVGHVWVRVAPGVTNTYRREPATLLDLIARLHESRIGVLQERVVRERPPLRRREISEMNGYIGTELTILDAYRSAIARLRGASRATGRRIMLRVAGVADPVKSARPQRGATTVFISYSHSDARHQLAVRQHLALLEREGRVVIWWDERIPVGGRWEKEIADALNHASVVVLLVSRHFLSSRYCYEKEMTAALRRADRGRAVAIPAILSPCSWQGSPLAELKAVPKDGKPVVSFAVRDNAYLQIAKAVEAAVTSHTRARRRTGLGR